MGSLYTLGMPGVSSIKRVVKPEVCGALLWTRKQRRAYGKALSGLEIARGLRQRVRFFTLTSSPDSVRAILVDFQVLLKRIRAFLKKKGESFDIRYFAVRTSEGFGVIHGLLRGGGFIPVAWLRRQWWLIHHAFEVWISEHGSVGYFVAQYVTGGQTAFVRSSSSVNWIFRGWRKVWRRLLDSFGYPKFLSVWNEVLRFHVFLYAGSGFG